MDLKQAMNIIGVTPIQLQSMTIKDLTSLIVKVRQDVINQYADQDDEESEMELEDALSDIGDAFLELKSVFNTITEDTNEAELPSNIYPEEYNMTGNTPLAPTRIPQSVLGSDYPCFVSNKEEPEYACIIPTKYIPTEGVCSMKVLTTNSKRVLSSQIFLENQ